MAIAAASALRLPQWRQSTLELPSLPMVLIDLVTSCWQPIVFCHYNWQFPFLRPTRDEIVGHYRKVHGSEPPPEEQQQEEKEDQADADEAHAQRLTLRLTQGSQSTRGTVSNSATL